MGVISPCAGVHKPREGIPSYALNVGKVSTEFGYVALAYNIRKTSPMVRQGTSSRSEVASKRRVHPRTRAGGGLRGVSTLGHGQGEGPVDSKLSRSDDADGDGRGRSERSERSPRRGKLPTLRSLAHQKEEADPF